MVFPVTGGTQDTGYEISNSVRFDGSSAYMHLTHSSASNSKTFTWSAWVKRCGEDSDFFISGGTSSGAYTQVGFQSNKLAFYDQSSGVLASLYTNRLFRDPSAWYHVVFAIDTTQGTASNRIKIYVNGVQETSFSTETYPSQNQDLYFGDNEIIAIGTLHYTAGSVDYHNGYLADVHYIDGSQKAPTDFGETNDNGVWIPKQYTGSYGTNGFLLEFKQTGTSANSSGIGADTSGNDHHFTPVNLAAIDVTEDTPTNNFCTLNPLDVYASQSGTLSEGNTKLTVTTSNLHTAVGTIAPTNGKWYWEVELDSTDGSNPSNLGISDLSRDDKSNMPSKKTWGYGYNASTGDKQNNASNSSYGDSYTSGDILGCAMDLDNGAVYFSKNGTFQASGDPTSGSSKTNAAFTWTPDSSMNWCPYVADNTSGVAFTWLVNFGNPAFSISSGNSDANGYGNFEYAVPSGYYALCTKNLAEYG